MRLNQLSETYVVARLDPEERIPECRGAFWSVTRTPEELSVVCEERFAPEGASVEGGWRCLRVEGPLGFSLVGVLAGISTVLSQAGVSIFVVSTYDTDFILVKSENLDRAVEVLRAHGHEVG